jgi:hypothetical protein
MDLAPFPALSYQQSSSICGAPILRPRSYLLNIPAELRVQIYEYVFETSDDDYALEDDNGEFESPAKFLAPLLTCKLIHNEAYPLAFQHANFLIPVQCIWVSYISPRILALPDSKLVHVRRITIIWDVSWTCRPYEHPALKLFSELAEAPLNLTCLTLTARRRCAYAKPGREAGDIVYFKSAVQRLIRNVQPLTNVERVVVMAVDGSVIEVKEDPILHDKDFGILLFSQLTTLDRSRLSEWMYRDFRMDDALQDGRSMWALEMTPRGAPKFEDGSCSDPVPEGYGWWWPSPLCYSFNN